MRKRFAAVCVGILALMLTACGPKDSPGNNGTEKPPESTVTVTPEPTKEPTATPTVTVAPTPTEAVNVTPTVTPTAGLDLVSAAAKARELRESIMPAKKAGLLGTGQELTEEDKKCLEYGADRSSGITDKTINLLTGEEAKYEDQYQYVAIDGLRNAELQRQINDRLKKISRTMASPDYLPDAAGIMMILKQRGMPVSSVSAYANCYKGILNASFYGEWSWSETGIFNDTEELYDRVKNDAWAGNGSVFFVDTDYTENPDGTLTGTIRYVIRDALYICIDLRTGEELSLSDLFPEGFDYLTYMNEEIERQSQYIYWFDHDTYESEGNIGPTRAGGDEYDETREYDGGRKKLVLTGDEMFSFDRNSIGLGNGIYIYLPYPIANHDRGENLYWNPGDYYVDSIGSVDLCEEDMDGPVNTKEIGSFRMSLNGTDEIKVTVYRGEDDPDWYGKYNTTSQLEAERGAYFTDENIINLAKQCMALWADPVNPKSNCKLYFDDALLYPKGYAETRWIVFSEDTVDDGDFFYQDIRKSAWMKDGKIIPMEELFDVSYEDLLTELIGSLRLWNQAGIVADEESARKVAKALMPYFVGVYDVTRTSLDWDWSNYEFRWKEGGQVWRGRPYMYGEDKEVYEAVFRELKDSLPTVLWESLTGAEYHSFSFADRCLVQKHLLMYKGLYQ